MGMKSKKSRLPITKADMASAQKAVETIQTPAQVGEVKLWISAILKFYEKRGLFEKAFQASELWVQADRKLYEMTIKKKNKFGVIFSDSELAGALNIQIEDLHVLRRELQTAYAKPQSEISVLKRRAFESKRYLTRKLFQ